MGVGVVNGYGIKGECKVGIGRAVISRGGDISSDSFQGIHSQLEDVIQDARDEGKIVNGSPDIGVHVCKQETLAMGVSV